MDIRLTESPVKLIVTRPSGQEQGLIKQLNAWGIETLHQPLIHIQPLPDDENQAVLRRRFLNIDGYDRVIAISQNAAELGLQWLDTYWPQIPTGIRWYGVGSSTASALVAEVGDVEWPQDDVSSEGLLALPSLQQIQDEKILIWRGVGGRETLAKVLRERGAQVDYAELYRRAEIDYSNDQWQTAVAERPGMIVSSGQALDIIQQQADFVAEHIGTLWVPSQRVAQGAQAYGYQDIVVADSARDIDVLKAVQDWL